MLTVTTAMRTTPNALQPLAAAKVVSVICGGQTGADRAAVDFALAAGVAYGGWVSRGGWAEDYLKPPGLLARYPNFVATDSDDPAVRSALNVRDSNATLVVSRGDAPSPGTSATRRAARDLARPLLEVDFLIPSSTSALRAFLADVDSPIALNVAGPRESESPGLYRSTYAWLEANADLFEAS